MEAHDLSKIGGKIVGAFPVEDSDEILMVTDQGQLIRIPVERIRRSARKTKGVIIFRTSEDEHVVSVERLADTGEDEAEDVAQADGGEPDADGAPEG